MSMSHSIITSGR